MKKKELANIEKNLYNQTTTQERNRVVVCRAYLSHKQRQQLFQNQGCIRFVSNALLGIVQLLNQCLVDKQTETLLRSHSSKLSEKLSKSDLYYVSILDKIKDQIETVKDRIREQDNEKQQALEDEKSKTVKSDDLAKINNDLEKLKQKRLKQEEYWKQHPVLLDKRLFNKLLLWLKDGFPFLQDADSTALVKATYDVLASLIRFVNGRGKVGYPHFKKKGVYNPRLSFPNGKVLSNQVKLPKMDAFRIRKNRKLQQINPEEIKSIDMVYDRKWLCHILIQQQVEQKPSLGKLLGIDRGITVHLALSNGKLIPFPKKRKAKIKRLNERLKKVQRLLSRSQLKSKNRQKLRLKLKRLYRRIRMIKLDWQRRLAHRIVIKWGFHHIALEDLNIQNMTKSAKGTKEKPGKNVKAKSGLNRSILAQSWYQLERLILNKLEEVGGTLVKVRPHYTSQICSCCGEKHPNNRHKLKFKCLNEKCGHENHADLNAAINIKKRYLVEKNILLAEWNKRGLTPPHKPCVARRF